MTQLRIGLLILPTAPHHSAAISCAILHWAVTSSEAAAALHSLKHPVSLLLSHHAIIDSAGKSIFMDLIHELCDGFLFDAIIKCDLVH